MWGDYGSGKTHCFYHFKWRLERNGLKVVYARFPEGARNFLLLSRQAFLAQLDLDELSKVASKFYHHYLKKNGATEARKIVHERISRGWSDFTKVFLTLCGEKEQDEAAQSRAQMWLLGTNLSRNELAHLGLTSNVRSDSDAIRLLCCIVRTLVNEISGYKGLILMLDECEEIGKLSGSKGIPSIQQGIRDTLDGSPRLCITLAFTMSNPSTIDNFLSGGLTSRLPPGRYLRVKSFSTPEAKTFVADLLKHFRTPKNVACSPFHPFDEDAVDLIMSKIIEKEDLNPRAVLKHFERILIKAARQGIDTISSKFVGEAMEELRRMDSWM